MGDAGYYRTYDIASSLKLLEIQLIKAEGDASDVNDASFTERRKNEEIKHI